MPREQEHSEEHTHGRAKTVLLLIDVISDFEFEDGEKLFKHALPAAERIARLRRRAKRAGVPVVYVNDNFGHWRDNFGEILGHCLREDVRGGRIARLLEPEEDDYFVLKPKHSGFYSTVLELLLGEFCAERLILAGFTADICVLFTANDAYMRGYEVLVPRDCVASVDPDENEHALDYIERVLKADIRPSDKIALSEERDRG